MQRFITDIFTKTKMKRLLFILLLIFISTTGYSQGLKALLLSQVVDETPEYINNGGIAGTTGGSSVSVPYPSPVTSGNVLIMQIGVDESKTITTPGGWTFLRNGNTFNMSESIYYKVSTGGESGTINVSTSATSSNIGGIIYQYSNPYSSYTVTTPIATGIVFGISVVGSAHNSTGSYTVINTGIFAANDPCTEDLTTWIEDLNLSSSVGGGWTFTVASHSATDGGSTGISKFDIDSETGQWYRVDQIMIKEN